VEKEKSPSSMGKETLPTAREKRPPQTVWERRPFKESGKRDLSKRVQKSDP
jgi:hypothetical protein